MDFLVDAGFTVWQMLPLGPVGPSQSPYSPFSAFAGNPSLIPANCIGDRPEETHLERFREEEAGWLTDFALFTVIRQVLNGKPWWEWPDELRQRDASALASFEETHARAIANCVREQYLFQQAWQALHQQARDRGILLLGDLPMFVVADSADVWASPHLFRLDPQGRVSIEAGAPPDAFAPQGQTWGCPVYDWDGMREDHFDWWVRRLKHECSRFDLLRWDHFLGLLAGWEVPAGDGSQATSAADGQWRAIPGDDLLKQLTQVLGPLPLVAENLGIVTAQVENLRRKYGFPGMHVLQFAFDGNDQNPHMPAMHEEQGVVYTGTHDNDTSRGWFEGLDEETRRQVRNQIGTDDEDLVKVIAGMALDSRCRLAMLPMQDLLSLDSSSRMNVPGQAEGQWRCQRRSGAHVTPGARVTALEDRVD